MHAVQEIKIKIMLIQNSNDVANNKKHAIHNMLIITCIL